MTGSNSFLTRGTVPWRALLCLAFVAMLFKAAIPMGYMPDAQAARDGKLVLSFCLPGGMLESVPVALSDESPQASVGLECPFALASLAFLPEVSSTGVAVALASVRAQDHVIQRARPALPAAGPPIGPRAPPSNLV